MTYYSHVSVHFNLVYWSPSDFFPFFTGTGGVSDIVKAKSSGEDPKAIGGLVSNLPHSRVNKTKQHRCFALEVGGAGFRRT